MFNVYKAFILLYNSAMIVFILFFYSYFRSHGIYIYICQSVAQSKRFLSRELERKRRFDVYGLKNGGRKRRREGQD